MTEEEVVMVTKLKLLAAVGGLCVMAAPPAGAVEEYPLGDSYTGPAFIEMQIASQEDQAGVAGPRGEGFTEEGPAATADMTREAPLESRWSAETSAEDPAGGYNFVPPYLTD